MPLPSRSLSAAFDTNDHDILITRLSSWFGIHGSVLGSIYTCHLIDSVSNVKPTSLAGHFLLRCPPRLCSQSCHLHNSRIVSCCSLNCHLYADETQLFLSFIPTHFNSSIDHLQVSQLEFPPGWLELPDNIFNWVNDFLHCTRYAGYSSSVADIMASIIQGSGLGPASYSIMAADHHPVTNGNELLSSPTTRT